MFDAFTADKISGVVVSVDEATCIIVVAAIVAVDDDDDDNGDEGVTAAAVMCSMADASEPRLTASVGVDDEDVCLVLKDIGATSTVCD